jgi:hypothetical protein
MDANPPANEPSLRPGDILLFHGHGFVSWAIRRFDESDVDRAAIVLRPGTMAEATVSGLRHVEIQPAIDANGFTYVRRLTAGAALSSVVEQALAFPTDLPLTNDQTVLLAVLAMTRKLPLGEPTLRRLLTVLLDRAAGILDDLQVRRRSLMFSSEFVYRCFERPDDPRTLLEVRPVSVAGHDPRPALSIDPMRAELTLWDWASRLPDPTGRTAMPPEEPLESLIAAFARVDSPNDPFVSRSPVANPEIAESARPVHEAQLLAASVRFRDAMLRLDTHTGPRDERDPHDRWKRLLAAVSVVTPGDLRYSHSLQTVTSLRPSLGASSTSARLGRASQDADH